MCQSNQFYIKPGQVGRARVLIIGATNSPRRGTVISEAQGPSKDSSATGNGQRWGLESQLQHRSRSKTGLKTGLQIDPLQHTLRSRCTGLILHIAPGAGGLGRG